MIINLNDWIDAAQSAQGETPASEFANLGDLLQGRLGAVRWHVTTARHATQGAAFVAELEPFQRFLNVQAQANGVTTCPRCLGDLPVTIEVDNTLQVFQTEAAADASAMNEDADAQPDPIVTSRQFNLIAQIEEELLLALDLHRVHNPQCELPQETASSKPNPFAALAGLKLN